MNACPYPYIYAIIWTDFFISFSPWFLTVQDDRLTSNSRCKWKLHNATTEKWNGTPQFFKKQMHKKSMISSIILWSFLSNFNFWHNLNRTKTRPFFELSFLAFKTPYFWIGLSSSFHLSKKLITKDPVMIKPFGESKVVISLSFLLLQNQTEFTKSLKTRLPHVLTKLRYCYNLRQGRS